jgi:hypothetical protein
MNITTTKHINTATAAHKYAYCLHSQSQSVSPAQDSKPIGPISKTNKSKANKAQRKHQAHRQRPGLRSLTTLEFALLHMCVGAEYTYMREEAYNICIPTYTCNWGQCAVDVMVPREMCDAQAFLAADRRHRLPTPPSLLHFHLFAFSLLPFTRHLAAFSFVCVWKQGR